MRLGSPAYQPRRLPSGKFLHLKAGDGHSRAGAGRPCVGRCPSPGAIILCIEMVECFFFFSWFFTVPSLEGEQFLCLRTLLRRSLWRGPAHPALSLGVVCPSDDRGGVVVVTHPTLGLVCRVPGSQRKMSGVVPTAHSYHHFPLDPVKQTFSRRNETCCSRNTSVCEHVRPAT